MPTPAPVGLTEDTVEAVARGLVEEIRSREIQTERDRRVPDENIKLLADSGLLGICRAKKWGGEELSMQAHVTAASIISEACHATAWVLGVYHAHDYIIGHMSPKAQEEIYTTNPHQAVAAVIGPRGKAVQQEDGGFLLSGFWPFASGNAASDWMLLGGSIIDSDGNVTNEGDFAVPMSDIERLDDWHVAGLQGTGSSSVKCADVYVPAHRFVALPDILEHRSPVFSDTNAPTIHRSQAGPVLGMFIATSAIGAAKRTVEVFRQVVPGKMVMYTGHTQSHEWSAIQIALGEAAGLIRAAELMHIDAAGTVDDYARRGEKMPLELRGRYRMDLSMVTRMCRDAVNRLYTIGGAAGLSLKSPIQLNARNLQAVNMHGLLLYEAGLEIYGRCLLGEDPGTPIL